MPVLFLLMQELAGADSGHMGFGREFVEHEGVFWALSRVSIRCESIPMAGESISLLTWHGDAIRYVFPRFFCVTDESGREVIRASTVWMLVDRESRQLILPSRRGFHMPPSPREYIDYDLPGRLPVMELSPVGERTALYSDFDLNGHMNNARYPLWMLDLFPPDHFLSHTVRELQIQYKKEILSGERVTLHLGREGNAFVARGEVLGENRFEAGGSFLPIL